VYCPLSLIRTVSKQSSQMFICLCTWEMQMPEYNLHRIKGKKLSVVRINKIKSSTFKIFKKIKNRTISDKTNSCNIKKTFFGTRPHYPYRTTIFKKNTLNCVRNLKGELVLILLSPIINHNYIIFTIIKNTHICLTIFIIHYLQL